MPLSRRRGGQTGSYRLDDAHGVIGAQNYAQWSQNARQYLDQGGRIVKRGDSSFHIVSPAGLDWGTFDRMSGRGTNATLRPVKEDQDFEDVTDKFRNE